MAGESVVGALRAILSLDVVQFEEGAKKAQTAAQGFGAEMGKIFGEVIAIETIKKIGEGILNLVDGMDKMGKSAQKVGLSVEQFSALSYAAKLADVSAEELQGGMAKLDRSIAETAGGAKGPAADAFKALGISMKTLQTNNPAQILADIADKFQMYADGQDKVNLAMKLFGRGGAEFIAFLNEGSDGLKKAAAEADSFGQIISTEAFKSAQDFMDGIKRLAAVLSGAFLNAIKGVLDIWVEMINDVIASVKGFKDSEDAVTLLGFAFKYLTGVTQFVIFDLLELVRVLGLITDVGKAVATGDFSKIPELFINFGKQAASSFDALVNNEKALFGFGNAAEAAAKQYQQLSVVGDQVHARLEQSFTDLYQVGNLLEGIKLPAPRIDEANKKLDEFIDGLQKSQVNAQVSVLTFGQLAGAAAALKIQMEAAAVAAQNHTTISAEQQVKLDALKASASNFATILEALNVELANRTPQQVFQDDLKKISDLYNQGAISAQTFENAALKAATNLRNAYGQVANQIVGDMASAFKTLAQMNSQYAGIAKAFAIGQAIISTYLAANNAYAQAALLGGPILGAIAAAAAVAAGLANVAKIAATPFASGGSFKVGGGRSFTDTQMVSLALAPGEMVDVHRTGTGGGSGGNGATAEISVSGLGVKDFFTGGQLRDLFDALNQGYRDGYKLKVV